MSIASSIFQLKNILPQSVQLIAVSKKRTIEDIMWAYTAGQCLFAENRVQEIVLKYEQLPDDIQWHFIGHLQTNKVKFIAPFIDLIHSVDSLRLLKEIDKEALLNNRQIDCLLEFHIAEEESKFGLNMQEAVSILESHDFHQMQNIRLIGVMGMATLTDDVTQNRTEFRKLKDIFTQLKSKYFFDKDIFKEISMGMSDDFEVAIEEGSSMVRIGTAIFGERH
ncbi:MAG: YggS family pyridoxal phosphate-dependent enzyme [Bacteroidota bacterium]